jgi:hypothetical protein
MSSLGTPVDAGLNRINSVKRLSQFAAEDRGNSAGLVEQEKT